MRKRRCPDCRTGYQEDQTICGKCGFALLSISCDRHQVDAIGRCVICGTHFCRECGKRRHRVYLCKDHKEMPIIEDFAGVYGGEDEVQVRFLESLLKEAGLHTHLYMRKVHPISTTYHLAGNLMEAQGRISNAILILVPFEEIAEAQSIIKEAELSFE